MDYLNPPQNIEENIIWRGKLLSDALNDVKLQQSIIATCAADFKYFCNAFLWTYDPREADPHKVFVLWPKQEKFIDWLDELLAKSQAGEKVNGYVDKSRGVGASYVFMAWCLWHYLFDDFSARIGSRKEDYVDKAGDPDALFYKLDYMLDRLPSWLVQAINNRAYLILKRADSSGNSVVGESANPNFGRGGRKSVIGFDEFGFWDWARSSWESAGEATNFRLAITTPPESGHDSHAWRLLTGQAGKVYKFSFDWNDDPRRDAKWLAEAKETKSDEEFAREVLKSFEGTVRGKVYAMALKRAELSAVAYNPELPLFVSWDFGLDEVAMIWWQIDFARRRVKMIDCYSNTNKEIDFYVPLITGLVPSEGNVELYKYNEYELEEIERHRDWTKTITHFGDPDVAKRNLINKDSVKEHLYHKRGIYIQSKPWAGREWLDMREKAIMLFARLEINEKRCEPVLAALRNAKLPEIREGSQRQNEPLKPVHDWTSHFRTSYEYFADNEPTSSTVKTTVGAVGNPATKVIPPQIEEQNKIKEEKDKLAGLEKTFARTVVGRVDNPVKGNSKFRVI